MAICVGDTQKNIEEGRATAALIRFRARQIVSEIIEKIKSGDLGIDKWELKISVGGNGQDLICHVPEGRVEVYIYGGWFGAWRNVWYLRIHQGQTWKDMPLGKDDKKFLYSFFKKVEAEKEKQFLDTFSSA